MEAVVEDIPVDYSRFKVVTGFSALCNEKFSGTSGIVCPRTLKGDFEGLSRKMAFDAASGHIPDSLQLDALKAYAATVKSYQTEFATIISDMQKMQEQGRKPYLKVTGHDYEDYSVVLPHIDRKIGPANPDYDPRYAFEDKYLVVYSGNTTRHVAEADTSGSNVDFDGYRTYKLKPDAQIGTIGKGDIVRFPREGAKDSAPFIHWAVDNQPKLLLNA